MLWGQGKKISDAAFKIALRSVIGAGLVTYLGVYLIAAPENISLVLGINVALLSLTILSLLFIIRLLRHIQTREEEMADMRSDFVAVASHELRSPLSAVRWYLAELRGDATLSQDARKIANDLYERICALIDLTTTFFMMTTADRAPLQSASMKSTNIATSVRAAIEAAIATARARNIKIEVQAQLETPILIKADPARLRIVFDNILSNAIKYSREGTTVTFSYEDAGATKRFVVHDTGIGVPMEEIERIFSGYHRAANAKRSGKLGSGFGLYMAKKIVDMHGGTIICRSSSTEGTTFTVTLPSAS